MKQYLWLSVPLLVIQFSRMRIQDIDMVMINFLCSPGISKTEVGYYTAGLRFGTILQIFMVVSSVIFFPTFSGLVAKNELDRIKSIIKRYENFAFCIVMPFSVSVIYFSKEIILLLVGKDYLASTMVMQFLTLGLFFMLLYQPYMNLLIGGYGKIKTATLLYLFLMSFNICLNAILIPSQIFGINSFDMKATGAAIATSISYFLTGILVRQAINNEIKLHSLRDYIFNLIVIILLFLLFTWFNSLYDFENIYSIFIGIPLFITFYIALIYILDKEQVIMAFSSLAKIHPFLGFGLVKPGMD